MHDAIELEKKGTPATVLVTKPFNAQARSMATILGAPGYQYAVIDHPMGSLTDEEVMGRSKQALEQVLEQITA